MPPAVAATLIALRFLSYKSHPSLRALIFFAAPNVKLKRFPGMGHQSVLIRYFPLLCPYFPPMLRLIKPWFRRMRDESDPGYPSGRPGRIEAILMYRIRGLFKWVALKPADFKSPHEEPPLRY